MEVHKRRVRGRKMMNCNLLLSVLSLVSYLLLCLKCRVFISGIPPLITVAKEPPEPVVTGQTAISQTVGISVFILWLLASLGTLTFAVKNHKST
jgi:hypothetical protein